MNWNLMPLKPRENILFAISHTFEFFSLDHAGSWLYCRCMLWEKINIWLYNKKRVKNLKTYSSCVVVVEQTCASNKLYNVCKPFKTLTLSW